MQHTRSIQCLSRAVAGLGAVMLVPTAAAVSGVGCNESPENAAVKLFEIIEDPRLDLNAPDLHQALFSERLRARSSNESVNVILRSARTTYQDRQDTPLSRRLVTPPTRLAPTDPNFNTSGDATISMLSLSTRGKIEQRMSISCEQGLWKIQSLSYGASGSSSFTK